MGLAPPWGLRFARRTCGRPSPSVCLCGGYAALLRPLPRKRAGRFARLWAGEMRSREPARRRGRRTAPRRISPRWQVECVCVCVLCVCMYVYRVCVCVGLKEGEKEGERSKERERRMEQKGVPRFCMVSLRGADKADQQRAGRAMRSAFSAQLRSERMAVTVQRRNNVAGTKGERRSSQARAIVCSRANRRPERERVEGRAAHASSADVSHFGRQESAIGENEWRTLTKKNASDEAVFSLPPRCPLSLLALPVPLGD